MDFVDNATTSLINVIARGKPTHQHFRVYSTIREQLNNLSSDCVEYFARV